LVFHTPSQRQQQEHAFAGSVQRQGDSAATDQRKDPPVPKKRPTPSATSTVAIMVITARIL
jgi:hypothetical protein